ncbi:hypothetical protein OPT61_g5992 [Boeremia exigua]|uniref:Uncharacterized protein n=1 Tax=Boeremia exigua TaxID=749465 RepID=A0ACC2I886_9PLEO|nr:hypothetical protein OPT61_g5992 [Boeremia exigua]
MRRKVTVVIMADGDSNGTDLRSRSGPSEQRQSDEVACFANRLHGATNIVAQALLPVVYLREGSNAQVTETTVQKVYSLAAALSTLLDDLTMERVSRDKGLDEDMWTKEHHENLLSSMEDCLVLFKTIARVANEQTHDFDLSNEHQAQDLIEQCFRTVGQTRIILKHTALARSEKLSDSEMQEALRLTEILQQPEIRAIWALKDKPFASKQLRAVSTHTPATTPPASPRVNSKQDTGDVALSNDSQPTRACADWSPLSNPQHPVSVASSVNTCKSDEKSVAHASASKDTPASASKGTPVSGHGEESLFSTNTTVNVEPGTVTFGQPSIIKPRSFRSLLPTGSFNAFNPTPHLEAYMICPKVKTTDATIELSFGLEFLRLSEEVLQAVIQSPGLQHNIVDVLVDLQPQILKLIQSQKAQRQGIVVLIDRGEPVDVQILAQPLQIQPVVFIISTTMTLPQDSLPVSAPAPQLANSDTKRTARTSPLQSFAPAPFSGFSNPSFANSVSRHFPTPEAYSRYLQERGKLCTYVERREDGGLQNYQTITANESWHDKGRSFEEIRLADYKAGRQRPMKTNGVSYPWDYSPEKSSMSKGDGSFEPPQPTTVNEPRTGWIPTLVSPGYAFTATAPKVSPLTQNANGSERPLSVYTGPSGGAAFPAQDLHASADTSQSSEPRSQANSQPGQSDAQQHSLFGQPQQTPPRSSSTESAQHAHSSRLRTNNERGVDLKEFAKQLRDLEREILFGRA